MGSRKYPPAVVDRVRELRAKGASFDEVRSELAKQGHPVSAGWLSGKIRELERDAWLDPDAIPEDDKQAAEWALARIRHERPEVAVELDRGDSIVAAIANVGLFEAALLRSPESIAELARVACEFPGFVQDAPKGEGKREHARAVRLLEQALAIVKARGIASRWGKAS